ncbi:MAG TPA: hypothetical protein ENH07_07365 [Nitrospirae bacterium]|nr:ATP-dependent DNA helicase PcrA [bacterium BMS3Abin08]HDO36098.1 hypothetical protein [Nitrospirota bacterium]HDY71381.1 hypothetical protein [Nitrospirota bacterium]
MDTFRNLNEAQRKAVLTAEGPLLVVAGPGTGKTMTIVRRIEHLIDEGIRPENILAVTFTNRAAREMRERLEAPPGRRERRPFIGTVHSLGLRILSEALTFPFVVYNREDQRELLRRILKGGSGRGRTPVDRVAESISRIKNLIETPGDELRMIYERYNTALSENSALDFEDLILKPLDLLRDGDTLERFREEFKYILVDEYQDINPAQRQFFRLLSGSDGNICAVGDPDQAIYGFRGADVVNFLRFEDDFRGVRRITLTENYRSTATVLNASGSMIRNNIRRLEKEVVSVREDGVPITVISVPDEKSEGEIIVGEIERRIGGTSHYKLIRSGVREAPSGDAYGFSDFAVIFRTNAQAGAIEGVFMDSGIPCQVVGGTDPVGSRGLNCMLSWLRVIMCPWDDLALYRVAAMPPSGVNRGVLREAGAYARDKGVSLYEAMREGPVEGSEFVSMIDRLHGLKDTLPIDELLREIPDAGGLKKDRGEKAGGFLCFLNDLAAEYGELKPPSGIRRFMDELSIMTPADGFDPRAEAVTLMTMHMAKGLEFRVVFIAGVEGGLVPYTFKEVDMEEERRLFYVAMTRAKDELFILHARERFLYGQRLIQGPSPFLREIPQGFTKERIIPDRVKRRKEKDKQGGLF